MVEETSLFLPEVPSRTTADRTAKYDPLDGTRPAKAGYVSTKMKLYTTKNIEGCRNKNQKLRAPDSEDEEQESSGTGDVMMEG